MRFKIILLLTLCMLYPFNCTREIEYEKLNLNEGSKILFSNESLSDGYELNMGFTLGHAENLSRFYKLPESKRNGYINKLNNSFVLCSFGKWFMCKGRSDFTYENGMLLLISNGNKNRLFVIGKKTGYENRIYLRQFSYYTDGNGDKIFKKHGCFFSDDFELEYQNMKKRDFNIEIIDLPRTGGDIKIFEHPSGIKKLMFSVTILFTFFGGLVFSFLIIQAFEPLRKLNIKIKSILILGYAFFISLVAFLYFYRIML